MKSSGSMYESSGWQFYALYKHHWNTTRTRCLWRVKVGCDLFLCNFKSYRNIWSFKLVLERKAGKEILESLRSGQPLFFRIKIEQNWGLLRRIFIFWGDQDNFLRKLRRTEEFLILCPEKLILFLMKYNEPNFKHEQEALSHFASHHNKNFNQ